jgi:beta-aspartyl-peptidase (threonine type)
MKTKRQAKFLSETKKNKQVSEASFAIAIHGGAGNDDSKKWTSTVKKRKLQALQQALEAGYQILQDRGSSLDAVQAAVIVLENSEFFNAGKGAVLTKEKSVELDASIMCSDSRAGAVGCIKETKNPILLARQVMEHTPYVLLIGEKADQFAFQQGLKKVPNDYFITKRGLKAWQKAADREKGKIKAHSVEMLELGTVGAVAVDQEGILAAATSTGGINYKMAGRVGDSAIIGAGTYATEYCAVSCTGLGEVFIRQAVASVICQLVKMGVSLEDAAFGAIFEEISFIGGLGGLIAMDRLGCCVMPFSTLSMSRGYWRVGGKPHVYLD